MTKWMHFLGLLTLIALLSSPALANQTEQITLLRSPKVRALAQAFRSGKLPEPARLPPGNIDRQAAALAKAVATGDDSSTAALYAAILASGYGVRDTDKSVMQTIEHGQGLLLESWEVAAMAKLYGEEYGVTLAHLAESFTRSVPQLKDAPLADAILDGIRKGAKSNQPAVRFWSQFIVALGKNSAAPYDLARQVDPTRVRLDAVQVALILSRLGGDFAVLEKQNVGHHARTPNPQSPCGASDTGDVVLDYNALASTTLFGLLMDRVGGGGARYGKIAGVANAILTVFKFIASYAALEVEITMDGDKLVRTKTTQPGERRTLKAKLSFDTGKWQMINCFRPFLNAAGLDINVPENGPIAGVNVMWVMVLGGDSRGWMGTVEDLFKILGGEAAWGDGIVFFDALPGADRSPAKQFTDEEGVSQIYIAGVPQQTDLSRRKLLEVNKAAAVRVDVQLKSMRIVDKEQALSNIMDIVGNAFAFLTRDIGGSIVGTGTETLYRSNWYSSQPFYFLVKDWEPCKGRWQGTITYKVVSKREGSGENNASTSYWKENSTYEAQAKLDGQTNGNGRPLARVDVQATEAKAWGGRGKGLCYRITDQVQTITGNGTEITSAFSIIWSNGNKEYSVSAPTPIVIGSGEHTIKSEIGGRCNNPYNKPFNQTNQIAGFKLSDDAPALHGRGVIDPANPDVISGSDTLKHVTVKGVEKTVTIIWNLRRCQDQ